MTFRPHRVRILLGREVLRLRKNPSGLLVLGLLTAIALLLVSSQRTQRETPQASRPPTCWVVYWEDDDWVAHLKQNTRSHLDVRFVSERQVPRHRNRLVYPRGDCAIELRPAKLRRADSQRLRHVRYRYYGDDMHPLLPYLTWFWPETVQHFGNTPPIIQEKQVIRTAARRGSSRLQDARVSDLVTVELIGTVLLFITQFFACCHLLVSFTSQDRERGTLMALALTPANTGELLVARFLFHLTLSLVACAAMIAVLRPSALTSPLLWTVLVLNGVGLMCVGTVIASLTRSQASASLLTLLYMLVGGFVFYLASQFSAFRFVQKATFEFYAVLFTYLGLRESLSRTEAPFLLFRMLPLVGCWVFVATHLFQRRGWR